MCDDGFHGDPVGARGQWKPCRPCQCSGNVDPNAVGVCDHATGRCLKCLHNTEGDRCERCKDGYYGNALDRETLHKCKPCNCSPMGSVTMQCHGNGTCLCREGFVGYKCDQCKVNYFHSRATHQCEECPVCYGLVRDEAAKLKEKLQALEEELKKYDCQSHRGYEHYPVQREGSLSNSLEDLLAMQSEDSGNQKSLADYMESIAKKALWASKQTLSLLSTIVEDHSTESYVRDLAGHFTDIHSNVMLVIQLVLVKDQSRMEFRKTDPSCCMHRI
ncbi:UNVERIFIED_CONTAM: hypothetical protein FKN15_044212 [Acipenser sinensis]